MLVNRPTFCWRRHCISDHPLFHWRTRHCLLRNSTYFDLITDMLDSVCVGFKRVLFFGGHGGNARPAPNYQYLITHDEELCKFREWYLLPKTYARIQELK